MASTEDSATAARATHLDPDTIAELEAALREERASLAEPIIEPGTPASDLTDDPGTRLNERDEAEALNAVQSAQLSQVERALARLEDGTYGVCESCDTEIPVERLTAMPSATLCVNCQARRVG